MVYNLKGMPDALGVHKGLNPEAALEKLRLGDLKSFTSRAMFSGGELKGLALEKFTCLQVRIRPTFVGEVARRLYLINDNHFGKKGDRLISES